MRGRHGQGIYFAFNSSYSCPQYSYRDPSGFLGVIFADVSVGQSCGSVDKTNLNMPILKPCGKERFDSVEEANTMVVVYKD